MSAFRKPFRVMENAVQPEPVDVQAFLRRQAPAPAAAPPSTEEQLAACRNAIKGLLKHGLRSDIALQAEHALELSGGRS